MQCIKPLLINDSEDLRKMTATTSLPDPTIDLGWDDYRGGKLTLECYRFMPQGYARGLTVFLSAIHEVFAANAASHPNRPCVTETRGVHNPERVFTYRQINESSNQLAQFFLARGCELGDVVSIYAYRG